MSNKLDQLFKKALEGKQEEPPSYVWENIEQHLSRRKKKTAVWWWRGIAAAALIAGMISVWELKHTDHAVSVATFHTPSSSVIEEHISTDLSDISPTGNNTYQQQVNELHSTSYEILPETTMLAEAKHGMDEPLQLRHANLKPEALPNKMEPQLAPAVRRDLIPLTSGEALRNNQKYLALLETPVSKAEKAPDKGYRMKIGVSGHVIPTYSSGSYSTSATNTRGYSYSKSQMEGMFNAGGGVRVSMATGKRLSVQTGLFYSRLGQKTNEKNLPILGSSDSWRDNNYIPTPYGNIKSRKKVITYRDPDAIIANAAGHPNESIEQTFTTLDIPLHVKYRLNNNKLSFSVAGGISGSFIVDNKVYLKQSGSGKMLLGSTDDIRNFNISTDFNVGVEYPLTPKLKVMFEPGVKYYIQSFSENSHIDFKPYVFSFSTGIGINF